MFPAGGVSTATRLLGSVCDLSWKPFTATLIARTGARVLPVHFPGHNGLLFQLASRVSLTLRLGLLMRALTRRVGSRVPLQVGEPIAADEVLGAGDREAQLAWLRARVYALGGRRER